MNAGSAVATKGEPVPFGEAPEPAGGGEYGPGAPEGEEHQEHGEYGHEEEYPEGGEHGEGEYGEYGEEEPGHGGGEYGGGAAGPYGDPSRIREAARRWGEMAARLGGVADEVGGTCGRLGDAWEGEAAGRFREYAAGVTSGIEEPAMAAASAEAALECAAAAIGEANQARRQCAGYPSTAVAGTLQAIEERCASRLREAAGMLAVPGTGACTPTGPRVGADCQPNERFVPGEPVPAAGAIGDSTVAPAPVPLTAPGAGTAATGLPALAPLGAISPGGRAGPPRSTLALPATTAPVTVGGDSLPFANCPPAARQLRELFPPGQDGAGWEVHTVTGDESLWTIAQRRYGDPTAWGALWRANPGIADPAHLTPGQVIRLPTLTSPTLRS